MITERDKEQLKEILEFIAIYASFADNPGTAIKLNEKIDNLFEDELKTKKGFVPQEMVDEIKKIGRNELLDELIEWAKSEKHKHYNDKVILDVINSLPTRSITTIFYDQMVGHLELLKEEQYG